MTGQLEGLRTGGSSDDPEGRPARSRRGVVLGAGAMAAGIVGAVGLGLRTHTDSRYPGLPRRPAAASAPVAPAADPRAFGPVASRITSPDRSQQFTAGQPGRWIRADPRSITSVDLHPSATGQRFEGAGGSLTQTAVGLLRDLPAGRRAAVLRRLFDPHTGAGISLLRQPLGSSDFSTASWTYADRAAGSARAVPVVVGDEDARVLAMVRAALHLNPRLQVIGAPWSAPAWMKTTGSLIGGTLRRACHEAFGQYLADVVTAYERSGIFLTAVSLQNEPGFAPPDYPGMTLSPGQQADLVRNHVGPALARAGSATRLLLLDHNWSDIPTVLPLLRDPEVRRWVVGTAVHGYSGFPGQQGLLSSAAPGLQIWETECSGGTWAPEYGPDLTWYARNLVVQGMRNGSASVVFWNVALDRSGGPGLNGGSTCRGVVTIDRATQSVITNVEYDVLRHLRVLVPGALRIESSDPAGVETAAWRNPDGSFVVFATAPPASSAESSTAAWSGWLRVDDRSVPVSVPPGGLCTFSWSDASPDS